MSLDDCKKERKVAKSAVTRLSNRLAQLVAEDVSGQEVKEATGRLKTAFHNFALCHESVVDNAGSTDESDSYFEEAQKKYIETLNEARSSGAEAQKKTDDVFKLLSLPKVELEVFEGESVRYHAFVKSFEVNVERLCTDSDARLARLLQFTSGEARDAIASSAVVGGEIGYRQAWDTLKRLYGSDCRITEDIVKSLRRAGPVKSPRDFRVLSHDLRNALCILNSLGSMTEVNSQVVIFDVIARLPNYVQSRFYKLELKSKRNCGKYLKFEDLVTFVQEIADDINDPLCGTEARVERARHYKHVVSHALVDEEIEESDESMHESEGAKAQSAAACNTEMKLLPPGGARAFPPCKLCRQPHSLMRCAAFKALKVSDRMAVARKNSLCCNCLRDNHDTKACLSKARCFVCNQMHSAFLHEESPATSMVVSTGECFMPMVKVLIDGKIWANAALDTFSSNTFITQGLADRLSLRGPVQHYTLKTLTGSSIASSEQVKITVAAGGESMVMSGVKIVKDIPVVSASLTQKDYKHLVGIDLSVNAECQHVDLLIGQDFGDALIPLAIRKSEASGVPYAVKYKFGWALSGKLHNEAISNVVVCNYISSGLVQGSTVDLGTRDDIHKLWDLENGVFDMPGASVNDKKVIDLWDRTCVKVKNDHYELPIPWKDPDEVIPNNVTVVEKRLENLVRRLKRDNQYDLYDGEVTKLLDAGYAEVVPVQDLSKAGRVWYLPHHGVRNINKPDRLRMVFDCAATYRGSSLNDRCFQGPDLVNRLLFVLLRFRAHGFAVQADVRAMYSQVSVPIGDRDALRFLWYDQDKLVHLRMTSHLFGGVWCASSSTYALRRTVFDNPNVDPVVKDAILNAMYVDDLTYSVKSKDDVYKVIIGVPATLNTGGFELTKFTINDEELMNEIPLELRAKEVHEFSVNSVGRTLGVKWKIKEDVFAFSVRGDLGGQTTRRSMLSYIAAIYDPLGLVIPWVIPGKLILQEATRFKLGWDEVVSPQLQSTWNTWIKSLVAVQALGFPRCVKPVDFDEGYHEYHVFADASERAYGACAYLRCVNLRGEISCRLIMSKAHVSPLNKRLTIPRLELQAAKCAADVYAVLKGEMNLGLVPVCFWTDSNIVLGYIRNKTRRFSLFVENRVGSVHAVSSSDRWRHVASQDNPADVLTKAGSLAKIDATRLWKNGPIWLKKHCMFWPSVVADVKVSDDIDPEVRPAVVNVTGTETISWVQRICEHHSSWSRIIRSIAWMKRFVRYRSQQDRSRGFLSAHELESARELLIKHIQKEIYGKDICRLAEGKEVLRSSNIVCLNPFLDDQGILRVGGRTKTHPVLLSHEHVAVLKLVRHYHERGHYGCEWTLSNLAADFWVTKARRLVRRVRYKCVTCKKLYARPITQVMADLPPERLQPNLPAFTYVGLDAFGPYLAKSHRTQKKRYGCIFTCMTTRAIHIEVLYSLDAESFICAFRRFTARRGVPEKVFSDNGRNFVRGEEELRLAFLKHSKRTLPAYTADTFVKWSFIPPKAPHQGGIWERMVGVVKRVLKVILPQAAHLTDEVLSTVFCEVESMVNNRPLTKLSDDPNDLSPLRPSNLLTLKQQIDFPPSIGGAADACKSRWKYVQHLAQQFWNRWLKEYLPALNTRTKWRNLNPNLKIGDLVLIQEPGLPRNVWPLAIVKQTMVGRDGNVRSAIVKTRVTELRRPITQLIRLEVD